MLHKGHAGLISLFLFRYAQVIGCCHSVLLIYISGCHIFLEKVGSDPDVFDPTSVCNRHHSVFVSWLLVSLVAMLGLASLSTGVEASLLLSLVLAGSLAFSSCSSLGAVSSRILF